MTCLSTSTSPTARPATSAGSPLRRRASATRTFCASTRGTTGAAGWDSGLDLVVEGTAVRVTDPEALQALADAWFTKYGEDWHYVVRGDLFAQLGPDEHRAHSGNTHGWDHELGDLETHLDAAYAA